LLQETEIGRAEGVQVVQTIDQAITLAAQTDAKEIFIIGGAEIFRSALPSADRIYLTLVHGNFDGDAFFPELERGEWKLISTRDCEVDDKNPICTVLPGPGKEIIIDSAI
jgi:dihydrofolate reductase